MNAIATPPSPTLVQALAQHLIQTLHLQPAPAVIVAFGIVAIGVLAAGALLMSAATAVHCVMYKRYLRREAHRGK